MKEEKNKIEDEKEKESNQKWLIVLIIIVAVVLLILGCSNKDENANQNQSSSEIRSDQEFPDETDSQEELTPEEVIAQLDRAEGIGVEQGPIVVEIISPEEKSFMPSQARHYRAEIEGLKTGSQCSCDWKFYLNENNEEVLYQEMLDRPCTPVGDENSQTVEDKIHVCGFTSTFIDKIGELRVEVEVEVEKQDEIVEQASAEKIYTVQ